MFEVTITTIAKHLKIITSMIFILEAFKYNYKGPSEIWTQSNHVHSFEVKLIKFDLLRISKTFEYSWTYI